MQIKNRQAIAMVELIFAIVVMAIVLMSAPNLISQSTKSSYVALQQESVNAAATHLNLILTKEWDTGNANSNIEPRVLYVSAGDAGLQADSTTRRRQGTPSTSYRKLLTGDGLAPDAVVLSMFGKGKDTGTSNEPFDDIDDYKGEVAELSEIADANDYNSDYKDKKIKMSTDVAYINDNPNSGNYNSGRKIVFDNPFGDSNVISTEDSTNIKAISVKLETNETTEELAKEIVLSAFMCNIGHYQLAKRTQP